MSETGSTTIVIGLLASVIVLLTIAIWSMKRHRDPKLFLHCDLRLDALIPSVAGLALGAPIEGNSVELVENGAYFDALLADIAAARHSVHFETFLWKDGVLGRRLADALVKAATAGIRVRMVLDAEGCKAIGKDTLARLRAAGCRVAIYHPRTLTNIGIVLERDHRKITVIDGKLAWVGGHCIVDTWMGDARNRDETRDISVRLRGPIVHGVQSVFSENWIEVTGELFAGEDVFPPLEPAGNVTAHIASLKPEGSAPAVKLLYYLAVLCAKERIRIQNPYFLPEPQAIEALARAVARGVDVRVMVPSTDASDMPIVQHAAHRNFDRLLASGVRIFEYDRTLLHQKVMTVDGIWCSVGSSNFDDRSLETNDEVTIGLHDRTLAKRLEDIFEADLPHCVELDLATWRKRGVGHRAKDSILYLFNEFF